MCPQRFRRGPSGRSRPAIETAMPSVTARHSWWYDVMLQVQTAGFTLVQRVGSTASDAIRAEGALNIAYTGTAVPVVAPCHTLTQLA